MSENKIPKIIHYCWFGKGPLPPSAIKCIESWKKHMPDYEIKRWDETNYDVNKNQYMKEAYQAKKYAFVADCARFDILYQYGGIYFDTDVEMIRPLYDIVNKGPFLSIERGTIKGFIKLNNHKKPFYAKSLVAPGLGIGGPVNFWLFKKVLDLYKDRKFVKPSGSYDLLSVCWLFAKNINFNKIEKVGDAACCDGVFVYPKDYFCPLSYVSRRIKITGNTRTIHWYDATWFPKWIRKFNAFLTKPSYRRYEKFINKNK